VAAEARIRYANLTGKMIRRGVFGSVDELIDAITEYLKVHNDDPKPFVWTRHCGVDSGEG
jgi:hypothetical protein